MRNYKTAPFDLEKALAGHMLVDGFGNIYTELKASKTWTDRYILPIDECLWDYVSNKGISTNGIVLSLYIPLTQKELALQALDEALQACEAAVNNSDMKSKTSSLITIADHIDYCKHEILSLPENPNP